MKYKANPVTVEAFIIANVEPHDDNDNIPLTLENGTKVLATPEMCSRHIPKSGDYWVIQNDGYIYINPRHVFERKYSVA